MASTEVIEPIIISREQIISAANQLAAAYDGASEYTDKDWLLATEHWLRTMVNNTLHGVVDSALGPHPVQEFHADRKCDYPGCRKQAVEHDLFCKYHREIENEYGRTWEADAASQFMMEGRQP